MSSVLTKPDWTVAANDPGMIVKPGAVSPLSTGSEHLEVPLGASPAGFLTGAALDDLATAEAKADQSAQCFVQAAGGVTSLLIGGVGLRSAGPFDETALDGIFAIVLFDFVSSSRVAIIAEFDGSGGPPTGLLYAAPVPFGLVTDAIGVRLRLDDEGADLKFSLDLHNGTAWLEQVNDLAITDPFVGSVGAWAFVASQEDTSVPVAGDKIMIDEYIADDDGPTPPPPPPVYPLTFGFEQVEWQI